MNESINIKCIVCSNEFIINNEEDYFCSKCGFEYNYKNKKLFFNFKKHLFETFGKKFLINQALNNNGYLSYLFLKNDSLSVDNRQDVDNFKEFIKENITGKTILDIGCGILERPAYLNFPDIIKYDLIGIDPINEGDFKGIKIIGSSEFIPLPDKSIDNIIFATSLDHVISIKKTIFETGRLLKENGNIFIWMGDRSFKKRMKDMFANLSFINLINSIKFYIKKFLFFYFNYKLELDNFYSIKLGRYVLYNNYESFYIPDNSKDQFHSCNENPEYIKKLFLKSGFKLKKNIYNSSNEVFLNFIL